MKKIHLLSFFSVFFLFSSLAFATIIPTRKEFKHFDQDKNGRLDQIERAYLRTHRDLGWILADQKEMLPFDINRDGMLSPLEWAHYQEVQQKNPNHFRKGILPKQ